MIAMTLNRRRRDPRRSASILRSRPSIRSKMLLCLVPIALAGCRSVQHEPQSKTNPSADAPAAANARPTPPPLIPPMSSLANARNEPKDPNVAQTDFHRKPTPEQKYNLHLDMGRIQEGQESFELALYEYQKALDECEGQHAHLGPGKRSAQRALAHRRIGAVLDRLGQFEQSEDHYRTALKLSPDDPKVWNDAGYSYYLQGRWADSERALKTAEKLDPHNTRVLINLGLTLAACGKTDAALAAFSRAGGPAVGHANLAYILAAMGKTDQAQQHYKIALDHQPDLALAKQALAALDAKAAQSTRVAAAPRPDPGALLLANAPGASPPIPPPVPPPSRTVLAAKPSQPTRAVPARPSKPGRTQTGQASGVASSVPLDPSVNRATIPNRSGVPPTAEIPNPQN